MIKAAMTLLAAVGLLLSVPAISYAVSFSDIVDFEGDGSYLGAGYEKIKGSIFTLPFTYEHRLGAIPAGVKMNNATLSLTHSGNAWAWERPEAWVLFGEAADKRTKLLGILGQSSGFWRTDSFALDQDWLNAIGAGGSPWELKLGLYDPTIGLDDLYLDRSVLSGDYAPLDEACTPVPEPGSLLLLTGGLAGLWGMKLAGKRAR